MTSRQRFNAKFICLALSGIISFVTAWTALFASIVATDHETMFAYLGLVIVCQIMIHKVTGAATKELNAAVAEMEKHRGRMD